MRRPKAAKDVTRSNKAHDHFRATSLRPALRPRGRCHPVQILPPRRLTDEKQNNLRSDGAARVGW